MMTTATTMVHAATATARLSSKASAARKGGKVSLASRAVKRDVRVEGTWKTTTATRVKNLKPAATGRPMDGGTTRRWGGWTIERRDDRASKNAHRDDLSTDGVASLCFHLSRAATAESSINQIGFNTPPSAGAAPKWDAIIEVGGSQQFVSEGRFYECHSLKGVEPGSKIAFERVLGTHDGSSPNWGHPYVKGARVEATVLENYDAKKVIVFKYRPKKHYRRKNGHRQPMTRFLVTKVVKA